MQGSCASNSIVIILSKFIQRIMSMLQCKNTCREWVTSKKFLWFWVLRLVKNCSCLISQVNMRKSQTIQKMMVVLMLYYWYNNWKVGNEVVNKRIWLYLFGLCDWDDWNYSKDTMFYSRIDHLICIFGMKLRVIQGTFFKCKWLTIFHQEPLVHAT